MTAAPHTHARQMSPRRRWCFRLLAVVLGLLVLPLLELVCAAFGWGDIDLRNDPFVGFSGSTPLFEQTSDGRWWHTSPARRKFFAEEQFAANKDDNEFRIFVLGGSTVQGRPWSIPTSLTTFLEQALTEAAPDRKWEVVNCGGISYASYRLVPILIECLQYEPDLVIVCTGHNEFLECITYARVLQSSSLLKRSYSALESFHSFRLLTKLARAVSGADAPDRRMSDSQTAVDAAGAVRLPAEVDAVLDHQGGLKEYTRAALHRDLVVRQFGRNLQRMSDLCSAHQLPLLFLLPPSNLRDCPPFQSEFSGGTDSSTRRKIADQLQQSAQQIAASPSAAFRELKELVQLDPSFAFSWYRLGEAALADHRYDEAREAFIRARDEDICSLRMTSALEQSMRQTAAATERPLLDLHQLLAERSRQNIVGDAVLADHIHPTMSSHQQIALAVLEQLRKWIDLPPQEDWNSAVREDFQSRLQSLDDMYYLRGRRTLNVLRAWTEGRGDGPPLPKNNLP
ncbi:MAG: hypothetical protein KDA89_16175 [Planctomycetaceae bacterium]|nr:hypothetical protein [Planctomycetaceae bacterium]